MADTVDNDMDLLKLIKKLPSGFQEEADSWSETKLRDCIVESTHNLETSVKEMEDKEAYKAAKAKWKDLSDPVRDIKKAQKSKISYCLHLLETQGKL
jgi:hypothetical protein